MTLGIKDVKSWTTAFYESVQELAEGFLGGAEVSVKEQKEEMPYALLGAFVQVVCSEGPVLLGITGSTASCNGLAKMMLGMEPEEDIAEADSFDAVGEIINIVAGAMKTNSSPPKRATRSPVRRTLAVKTSATRRRHSSPARWP